MLTWVQLKPAHICAALGALGDDAKSGRPALVEYQRHPVLGHHHLPHGAPTLCIHLHGNTLQGTSQGRQQRLSHTLCMHWSRKTVQGTSGSRQHALCKRLSTSTAQSRPSGVIYPPGSVIEKAQRALTLKPRLPPVEHTNNVNQLHMAERPMRASKGCFHPEDSSLHGDLTSGRNTRGISSRMA